MKNTIFSFIKILFVFCFANVFSQSKIDSLLSKLNTAKQDTNNINLLFEIENEYLKTEPDSALLFLQKNGELIKKLNAKQYEYDYNFGFVKVYHAKGEYEKALNYTLKCNKIAKKNKNLLQESETYRTLFTTYQNLGKKDLAIKYALYSLDFSKSVNDTINLSINYGNLSKMYNELEQYDKSIFYGNKGIEAGKIYKNTKGLLICINNTAIAYLNTNQFSKAEKLFKQQLEIANKENFPRSSSKALINLCEIYIQFVDKKNLEKSLLELNKILNENPDVITKNDKNMIMRFNAHFHFFNNNFQKANIELNKAILHAKKDSLTKQLLNLYELKASLKYAEHNYAEAEKYKTKSDSLNFAIYNEDMSKFSIDLEKKYEIEKKNKEILLLEKKELKHKILIYSLLALALGLLIFSYLSYRNYTARKRISQQKIIQLEQEKQIESAQNMIQGEEAERTRLARDLHDGLGGMLSGVKFQLNSMKGNVILSEENALTFTKSISQLDEAIAEMRRVAHNMMPETLLNFGLNDTLQNYCESVSKNSGIKIFFQSFGLENRLEQTTEIVIYRIVQELLNNTIKHANATETYVQISKNDNTVSLTVEDNGKGFDVNSVQKNGIGLSNIQHRVDYLKGKIDVQSDEKGTSTHIEFVV